MVGINGHKTIHDDLGTDITEEDSLTSLPVSALASVLKWSKDIAADIHLFSGISVVHCQSVAGFTYRSLALQRLTEIATGQLLENFYCADLTYYRQSHPGPRVLALLSLGQAESTKWLRA